MVKLKVISGRRCSLRSLAILGGVTVNLAFRVKSIMKKLLKSWRIGRFIKISLSVFIIIVSVVLNPLNLLNSYAAVSTSPVTSPLVEPESYYIVTSDGISISVPYVVTRPSGCFVYVFSGLFPSGTDLKFQFTTPSGNASNQRVCILSSSAAISGNVFLFDVTTGILIGSDALNTVIHYNNSSYSFRTGYFPRTTGIYDSNNDFLYGYPIIPSGLSIVDGSYPEVLNVFPYVTWAISVPDQHFYQSQLSEPVCDKYNRYFIVDDRFYWLSIQLNGFYIEKSVVENTTVVVPDYEFAGDETGHNPDNGTYYHIWQEFNGKQYIPVSLSSGRFSNDLPFYLTLIPGTSDIKICLEPYSFISGPSNNAYPYFLQSSFFLSEFNLEDGSYVNSSFTEINTEISLTHYLNLSVDSGSSVRCYGVNWFNNQNLPYNLASVLWGHDPVFAEWRDQMLIKLTQIYNVLSGSDQEPDVPTYPNYGGEVASGEPSFSDVSPDSVKVELSKAADSINGYSGVAATVRSWISDFMPTKLVVLIIFALSFGVVLLILGKNKDD